MQADLWSLYENMLRSRLFEEAVTRIWHDGRISGEMHLSIGEEAVVAGAVFLMALKALCPREHEKLSEVFHTARFLRNRGNPGSHAASR